MTSLTGHQVVGHLAGDQTRLRLTDQSGNQPAYCGLTLLAADGMAILASVSTVFGSGGLLHGRLEVFASTGTPPVLDSILVLFAAVLACFVSSAAFAQREPGTISATGTSRTRLPNTVADIAVGIEAHGRTVQALQGALAAGSEKLMSFLRTQNVERLRTEQVL